MLLKQDSKMLALQECWSVYRLLQKHTCIDVVARWTVQGFCTSLWQKNERTVSNGLDQHQRN